MVASVIGWLHEKGIYELATASMREPTLVLSETMIEMVEVIRTLATEEMLVTI
jgi:hypothetical protein